MKLLNCEQRTPEWFAARCGIPTASNFDKLITTEGKQSKQRTKYLYQLAGERVAGIAEDTYQSAAMARGNELEAEARLFYEMVNGVNVEQPGFCISDCERYGCSPDGFVGDDGILEIKCPSLAVHVGYLINDELPTEYFQQVHGELFVTGRPWCDFMSYYPGVKPLIVRVYQHSAFAYHLDNELNAFCEELNEVARRIS